MRLKVCVRARLPGLRLYTMLEIWRKTSARWHLPLARTCQSVEVDVFETEIDQTIVQQIQLSFSVF